MSISPRRGARLIQRLPCLKYYYDVLKWETKFTLELNDAKNADYLKKIFKWIKFPTKNLVGTHVYLPQEWS